MPYLATTRAGVKHFLENKEGNGSLWIGSDVLSEVEIEAVRRIGHRVSVFVHSVRSTDEIEDAVPTLREHYPSEPVWIEAAPDRLNPRSQDISQAFLSGEFVFGVAFQHNARAKVLAGAHKGKEGNLVALVALEPEVVYVLEADTGEDIEVTQSSLATSEA